MIPQYLIVAGMLWLALPRHVRPLKVGIEKMKTVKNLVFVLCILSVCSKVTLHTYQHFRPAAVISVAP